MHQEINGEIYPLFSGLQGLDELGKALSRHDYPEVYILVDDNTAEHCLPLLEEHTGPLKIIRIRSGEQHKTLETCSEIWEMLLQNQAGRNTLLLNLGGGVISDMGGFCAALYKRGIDFINIPTTLLAMVDASIGSKTGINFSGIKNTIGCFNSPLAVYIYTGFLNTLPEREFIAAFAEIAKHALIADKQYWEKLKMQKHARIADIEEVIAHSLKIKQRFIAADPHDKNIRKSLNFGHTIGHAMESASLNNGHVPLLHGEAVAAGIVMETYLSHRKCALPLNILNEVLEFYKCFFSGVEISDYPKEELLNLIKNDKKNKDGRFSFTLIREVGEAAIDVSAEDEEIWQAFEFYRHATG